MSAVDRYLANPASPWRKFRLWLWVTKLDVRDWCLRWIYAQHNARVLADFESRMQSVIYDATGGLMRKPYYTVEAMRQCIREHESATYDEGYADGRKDLAEELGVKDPNQPDQPA